MVCYQAAMPSQQERSIDLRKRTTTTKEKPAAWYETRAARKSQPCKHPLRNSRAGVFSIAYGAWAWQIVKGNAHVQLAAGRRASAALSNHPGGTFNRAAIPLTEDAAGVVPDTPDAGGTGGGDVPPHAGTLHTPERVLRARAGETRCAPSRTGETLVIQGDYPMRLPASSWADVPRREWRLPPFAGWKPALHAL
jgi:hypothetical protein